MDSNKKKSTANEISVHLSSEHLRILFSALACFYVVLVLEPCTYLPTWQTCNAHIYLDMHIMLK
jgi:hypothetical protein